MTSRLPTVCDLTQSYAATGGGIRTHLHAKRAWLDAHTDARHVLIVPGPEDATERDGRHVTHYVKSPPVPGSPAYRLMLRNGHVRRLLAAERPDVIECQCAYNLPWAALRHRREADPSCVVVGGYRTDFPAAYAAPLVGGVLGDWAGRWAEAVAYRYVGVASGAMLDRVPPGLGRLGPAGDVAAMAANVESVVAGDRAEMGRRAREHVEARFSWDATFGQLLGLYARAGRPLRPRRPSESRPGGRRSHRATSGPSVVPAAPRLR